MHSLPYESPLAYPRACPSVTSVSSSSATRSGRGGERCGDLGGGRRSTQRGERDPHCLGLLGHAIGPGEEGARFEGDFVDGGVFLDQGVLRET